MHKLYEQELTEIQKHEASTEKVSNQYISASGKNFLF